MPRRGTKYRKFIAAAFSALAALGVSCQKAPVTARGEYPLPKGVETAKCKPGSYGGTFVLAASQEPKTFNPLICTDIYSANVISMILSPLVGTDPFTNEPIPALAQSWEIGDGGKRYTFKLREGAKFSDGEEITADDVVFTFDTIFAPLTDENGKVLTDAETGKPLLKYPSRHAGQYTIGGEPVKYRKIDKYTVEFRTSKVYAPFMVDIGFVEILPRHKLKKYADDGSFQQALSTKTAISSPGEIVSSGPFSIFSYKPGERLVLRPNPHYWRADARGNRLPYIDFLIYKFVADANTSTILFATGQCDAADVAADEYAWVKNYAETYDFKIYERGPDSGIFFIWFNQNPGRDSKGKPYLDPKKYKWFSNRNFRRAAMTALDRDGLISGVWFGRAQKLHGIISPANKKWYNPSVRRYRYDPEAARALLTVEGFRYGADGKLSDPDGNAVEFDLLVADGSKNSSNMAATFAENMKAAGITVKLKFMDFGTMISKIDNTFDYDAAMMGFTGGGDPSGGKAIYRSDGFLHVWNPRQKSPATAWEKRVDEIMDLQEVQMDPKERKNSIFEMQKIFADELPLLYLVTPISYSGISKKWDNVKVPPTGPIIWNIDELYLKAEK